MEILRGKGFGKIILQNMHLPNIPSVHMASPEAQQMAYREVASSNKDGRRADPRFFNKFPSFFLLIFKIW